MTHVALESPGHGGSLQWKEHLSGHWSARGLGGKYDIYPEGTGGYKAYWEETGTGSQSLLGSYPTLGGAFAACRHHADGEKRAAEAGESGGGALASNVARQSAASAYGADQIDRVSGSGGTYNVWLKNGKRVTVQVDGAKGTVVDPEDGHVVATHTVSESAAAECGCAHKHPATVPVSPCDAAPQPTGAVALAVAGAREGDTKSSKVLDRTLQAIRSTQNSAGLAYIPSVTRLLVEKEKISIESAHKRILRLEHGEEISLYPDDGFGRLPAGDKKFTIHGPSGTHLAYAKIRHSASEPAASETVPVIHEANDAGPYATVNRDTKELAKGQALGKTPNPRAIYDLLHDQLSKESQEVFLVVPMSLYGEPISRPVEVARGQRDRVAVSIEDIFRPVIATNAKGFVVVHNHPGLRARPSPKDIELTESIKKKARDYSFHYLDHVIIATSGTKGEYYSFTEDKLTKV